LEEGPFSSTMKVLGAPYDPYEDEFESLPPAVKKKVRFWFFLFFYSFSPDFYICLLCCLLEDGHNPPRLVSPVGV
jgi:hypothetical protein